MKYKKVNGVNKQNKKTWAMDFEPLITVAEAARLLKLNEQTIYGWISKGKIEGLKLASKAVRIRPEAVRELIAQALGKAHEGKVA